MRVFRTKNTKLNMCDYCGYDSPAECPKANVIEFGNGKGNDNVTACSEYIPKNQNAYMQDIELDKSYGVVKSGVDAIVRQIIDDAFKLNGKGGVNTIPLINGDMMTNYVPWRKYFTNHEWTQEMRDYVKSLFA